MFSKADLGLGDASKAVLSPAPKPAVAAMTASPPDLQATSEPITPPVGEAPAKDVEETPTGGDQLDSLEILSGPASQEIAAECIIEDAGTKDVEASPLGRGYLPLLFLHKSQNCRRTRSNLFKRTRCQKFLAAPGPRSSRNSGSNRVKKHNSKRNKCPSLHRTNMLSKIDISHCKRRSSQAPRSTKMKLKS